MRKIITILPCHLSSQRVPKKPLQLLPNGDSLIVNALKQLKRLEDVLNPHLSCWPGDRDLIVPALDLGLPIIPMSFEQSRACDWETISEAWCALRTDWIFEVNNVCHPYLEDSTILKAYEHILTCNHPFISVEVQKNIFWTHDKFPLLQTAEPVDTKIAPAILSATHTFYGWQPTDCGAGNGSRLVNFYPLVLDVKPWEVIDIDEPDDLILVQAIAKEKLCQRD